MKKRLVVFGIIATTFTSASWAGTISDFFGLASAAKVEGLETEVTTLIVENENLKKDLQRLQGKLNSQLNTIKSNIHKQQIDIKALASEQHKLNTDVQVVNETINLLNDSSRETTEKLQKLEYAQSTIHENLSKLNNQKEMNPGILAAIVAIVLALLVFVLLRKRINANELSLVELQAKSEAISSKIVEQMASEVDQLEKIATVIAATLEQDKSRSSELGHELIKTLADRITFMEMTLAKMDKSVRGHKQLSKSIIQMKDNLLANGYELVEMLGHRYHEGMKVVANFIEDEDLPSGEQIITGIIKPQINYKGVMIQAAQITVSQNV